MQKVLRLHRDGQARGRAAGGRRGPRDRGGGKGFFVQPTVFDGVNNEHDHRAGRDLRAGAGDAEFDDVDEVVRQANENPYGLAAAVWTRDIEKAHRVARRLQAGTVWINTYSLMDAALPFGGFKQSGFGRELGAQALESYTEVKSVWLNLG